jgi:hypothetical protein
VRAILVCAWLQVNDAVDLTVAIRDRTETDRKITGEPWLSTLGQRNMTKENTLRSGCRSLCKKDLTEPTLLEMSGNPTYQLERWDFLEADFRTGITVIREAKCS